VCIGRVCDLTSSALNSKPETALADPWPTPFTIPKSTIGDDTTDYESELAIVIGRPAKDVSEADALDYVLGYTAANDISARNAQFAQTQWCFSKGFDGACPIGMLTLNAVLRTSATGCD
jgi:2-keto-4-pentenoate hydratase/2-oxohepta-3-ene-1,7-dioic acid hydratase in catechol pathway